MDIVAKGGNLLLNIAPGPDGTWDDGAYDLLQDIGDWMEINHEAIYETRAMKPYKENNICYTQKKDGRIFLFYLTKDGEDIMPFSISITQFCPEKGSHVKFLGTNTNLKWKKSGSGTIITIPEKFQKKPPCKYAWVMEVE